MIAAGVGDKADRCEDLCHTPERYPLLGSLAVVVVAVHRQNACSDEIAEIAVIVAEVEEHMIVRNDPGEFLRVAGGALVRIDAVLCVLTAVCVADGYLHRISFIHLHSTSLGSARYAISASRLIRYFLPALTRGIMLLIAS